VPLHVRCPQCGATYRVADEQAGGTATCPECQTLARIPDPGASSGGSPSGAGGQADRPGGLPQHAATFGPPQSPPGYGPTPPGYGPMPPDYGPWDPAAWRPEAERRVGSHLTIIAILDIVLSVLCLLWGLGCFVVTHGLRTGKIPMPPELQDPAVRKLALAMYPVLGAMSLVTFLLLLVAGIALVARRPSGRVIGLIAAGVCCASVWQCILFPFCLILGIYSFVILLGQDARLLFAGLRGPPGAGGSLPGGPGPVDSPR